MAKKHCIILLTLCLLLSACGAVEEPGYSITSAPDPVAADSPEPGELRYALSDFGSGAEGCNVLRSGDLLFYIYEDYSAGIGDPKTTLSVSELDGNGLRMLSNFNGSWLRTCCADQDGGLWALSYASLDDGSPELLHFDGDGTELARFSIDGSYIPAGCYPYELACGSDGTLYVLYAGADMRLLALDGKGGAVLASLDGISQDASLANLADGGAVLLDSSDVKNSATGSTYAGTRIRRLEGSGWGEQQTLNGSYLDVSNGADFDLYLCEVGGTALLGYDFESNGLTGIADSLELGLDGWNGLVALGGEEFILPTDGQTWMRLAKTAAGEITQLTFATLDADAVKDDVAEFNRRHSDIRITMLDYSQSGGVTALATEIIAGTVPDIIDLSQLPAEQYADSGLLTDLYPLMDTDGGPGRDDLWPNILEALEHDGALYSIPTGFYPVAVFGRADVVSQLGTLNYDTAEAELLTPELGYSTVFGTQLTRADFLKYSLELGGFIDYESRKSDFTGESFGQLLSFAAKLPESEDELSGWRADIADGRQALAFSVLRNTSDLFSLELYYGADIAALPFFGGELCVAEPVVSLGISSSCENKEAAWEFISSQLWPEGNLNTVRDGYPMSISAYERLEQSERDYAAAVEVNQITSYLPDGRELKMAMDTEGTLGLQRELIESIGHVCSNDATVYGIVSEESGAFFAGAKAAAEVEQLIQNRVEIYLAESE